MIGKGLASLVATHWIATEPYALSWDPATVRSLARFGWPLVVNGLLMLASQQMDQLLIAGTLSTEALASYALAFSIASIPWVLGAQPIASLALPLLSRAQGQRPIFNERYRSCVQHTALSAVVLTLPLVAFGERLVTFLFGAKYVGTGELVALLGVTTALRFVRLTPSLASMAYADTRNQLYSNIARSMSLPLAAAFAICGYGPAAIAAAGLLAELASGVLSAVHLSRRHGVPLQSSWAGGQYVLIVVGVACAASWIGSGSASLWREVAGFLVAMGVAVVVAAVKFPDTVRPAFREAASLLQRLRRAEGKGRPGEPK